MLIEVDLCPSLNASGGLPQRIPMALIHTTHSVSGDVVLHWKLHIKRPYKFTHVKYLLAFMDLYSNNWWSENSDPVFQRANQF